MISIPEKASSVVILFLIQVDSLDKLRDAKTLIIYEQDRPVSLILSKLPLSDWGKWQTKEIVGFVVSI